MCPIGEDNFLNKKNGFWSYSGNKTAEAIVLDLGRESFGCGEENADVVLQY